MALEGVTGSLYHDNSKTVKKPDNLQADMNLQDIVTADTNPEGNIPSGKVNPGNKSGDNQDMTKNDEQIQRKIKTALSRANSRMRSHRTRCEFAYHEETNRISIKIYDRETKEVIREIPPEETLEMIERIWELAGLLIDEKR